MRVVIGGGKDDQPRPSCVCTGEGAIALRAKYVLYKNAKPTELCSAVQLIFQAVNVRKVGAGVGSQTPFFFWQGRLPSGHTIRVNAISCSSQSLSLAPTRSQLRVHLLSLYSNIQTYKHTPEKKTIEKKCDVVNDATNAGQHQW